MRLTRREQTLLRVLTRSVLDEEGAIDLKKVLKVYLSLKKSKVPNKSKIIKSWFAKVKSRVDRSTLVIESAAALSGKEIDGIKTIFEKRIGRHLMVENRIRDDVLGGVRVHFEDEVWDASVASRLTQIETAIAGEENA